MANVLLCSKMFVSLHCQEVSHSSLAVANDCGGGVGGWSCEIDRIIVLHTTKNQREDITLIFLFVISVQRRPSSASRGIGGRRTF